MCAGGLGKTTLARLLFNNMTAFDKKALVELELTGSSDSSTLESKLAQMLGQLGVDKLPKGGAPMLLRKLAEVARDDKVLLVLDNINTDLQLKGLLPTFFSKGSRLIITSREEELPSCSTYVVSGILFNRRCAVVRCRHGCPSLLFLQTSQAAVSQSASAVGHYCATSWESLRDRCLVQRALRC
jgi:hypothetical protein